jgi:hypothetical protein
MLLVVAIEKSNQVNREAVMFPRKRIFAVTLVAALLGTSALAPAQSSAAHARVVGPLPGHIATVVERRRRRHRRRTVRDIVWRLRRRVRDAAANRTKRTTAHRGRLSRGSFARGPPRPQAH